MQFNNDSDNQDIVSLVQDMTGVNTTAELQQITRAVNEAYRKIWTWIFESYGGWVFDDGNNKDLPTAKADLVKNQSKYTLPSEALTIRGVEVKNTSDVWHKMQHLSEELIRQFYSEQEFRDTSSEPKYYTPYAGLIKLHPAPDYGQAKSLRLSFDRGISRFNSGDTSKEPGFASQFHEAVATGAAYYIAANKALNNADLLLEKWGEMPQGSSDRGYKRAIQEYYSQRFVEENPPAINQGRKTLAREYM